MVLLIFSSCNYSQVFRQFYSKNFCKLFSTNMSNSLNGPLDKKLKMQTPLPTAGIIIIGDEILKGQTADLNTKFIAERLYKLGIKVLKVSTIPDDVETISAEVAEFSKRFTHVITSGGIGPTHDDVTFESVANAFQEKLIKNKEIEKFILNWSKHSDKNQAALKMSFIPESSILLYGEDKETGLKNRFPCISVKNVVIFPGIPHLLQRSFTLNSQKLFGFEGGGFKTRVVYLAADESTVAPFINNTVAKYPDVTLGSYPELFHSYYKTKVTLESMKESAVIDAQNFLKAQIDPEFHVNFLTDAVTDPWSHLGRQSSPLRECFDKAYNVLDQTFKKYRPDEVILCYNGGKDCLVTLHITHMLFNRVFPHEKIQAIYIKDEKSFPQVTEFVDLSVNRYNLDLTVLRGSIKEALHELLELKPAVKAVLMGTRRIDPHGESLEIFKETDGDWPRLMRINPILEWNYAQVWSFIRSLTLPYCSLYDRGYTSLGNIENTLQNPSLETTDNLGRISFLPAFKLTNPQHERLGRL